MPHKMAWNEQPLSTLTSKIGSGSTPKGGRETYLSSGIPFIRSMNVGMRHFRWEGLAYIDEATHEAMSGTHVQHNDVLLNITGASIGRVACAPSDLLEANVNQHVAIIRPTETLNPRYLMYWLSQPKSQEFIMGTQKGATRQALTKAQIEGFRIPLPPFDEQRRIVARIDALAARIEEARRLRREAGEEAEQLFASSAETAYTTQEHWKQLRVSDICEPPQYGYTESATSEPVGPRFLRITDIQDGKVNWDTVPYCTCFEPDKYLLQPNDLVFARTGATTGKSFLITECPEPAVFASYLIRLRVREGVTPEYLYGYFQTPSYWHQISDETTGTGQPNVNGKKLANLLIPVPSLDEQQRIVAYLDEVQGKADALRRLQAEAAAELEALLPAVLDQAFRGDL